MEFYYESFTLPSLWKEDHEWYTEDKMQPNCFEKRSD